MNYFRTATLLFTLLRTVFPPEGEKVLAYSLLYLLYISVGGTCSFGQKSSKQTYSFELNIMFLSVTRN
jgi:hypothetical protein